MEQSKISNRFFGSAYSVAQALLKTTKKISMIIAVKAVYNPGDIQPCHGTCRGSQAGFNSEKSK